MIEKTLKKIATILHLPLTTIKFAISSFVSTISEYMFYFILTSILFDESNLMILIATITGRVIGTTINFFINKIWCFEVRDRTFLQAIEFALLFIVKLCISYYAVILLKEAIKVNTLFIKIPVELCLFFISYFIQKFIIFKRRREK